MGYRQEIYKDGELIEVIDTRTVDEYRAERIAINKAVTGDAILAAYPAFKQQNAALGLLSDAETTALKDGISSMRSQSDAIEASLNAAVTLDELDAITLFGE